MDIKPDTKVELKDGNVCKAMGQLEDERYMLRDKKGKIVYCMEKDIAGIEK